MVAVDTPDNLTSRLRGSETMYVQVDARGRRRRRPSWRRCPASRGSTVAEIADGSSRLEVESETGRDVRRELAAAIVGRGWGLLELRPMRMSLEEIFLHADHRRRRRDHGAEPPTRTEVPHE